MSEEAPVQVAVTTDAQPSTPDTDGSTKGFNDLACLATPWSGRNSTLPAPSYISRAVELGMAWAEEMYERKLIGLPVADWPPWPPWENATSFARRYARTLSGDLRYELPRYDPLARLLSTMDRMERAHAALERFVYEVARLRYFEMAARRLR
jgi:hypothetical protein